MQGKKQYQEKLFIGFQLSDHVEEDNFYRRLNKLIDFSFLYKSTSTFYGKEGQKSIDPVVFFKLMLVGYLENINSDRRIVAMAKLRLDILYFLGYNLDEELPWHSTLSRTRQLYGEQVFTEVFQRVLKQCIDKGMVAGQRQAIDSVFVKANASLDSLVEREILQDAARFAGELDQNAEDQANKAPVVRLTKNTPQKRTAPKKGNTKNQTHYSPSDPDAKVSVKRGKPFALNYMGQVSVDTASHVITHIQACKADKLDSQYLPAILEGLVSTLNSNSLQVEEVIADSGYSSATALKALEHHGITGYIPNKELFVYEREGFTYHNEQDYYSCPANEKLIYKGTYQITPGRYNKEYRVSKQTCSECPLKEKCRVLGRNGGVIRETADRAYYQRMHERMQTKRATWLMKKRQSTVEPVIGTLVNYLGMKKVYTKGLSQANKCMMLSATAYNIKKLLNYITVLSPNTKILQVRKALKALIITIRLLFPSNPCYLPRTH